MYEITPPNGGSKYQIEFTLELSQGHAVAVAGSFNDWDPSVATMKYNPIQKCYQVALELPSGEYEYKFVIDGEWTLDDSNENFSPNDFGTLNSVLIVE